MQVPDEVRPLEGNKEADLLLHLTYFAERSRRMEIQVLGWQELARKWEGK